MPPGADFGTALVAGLEHRFATMSPQDVANTYVYVNTARMQRRLRQVFDAGPARLLPRVRLVTDLAFAGNTLGIPAPVSPLRRRLELSQAVAVLMANEPKLAPKAALFDLSDSLATLMDEMQGEGVDPAALEALDVSDQSGHWQRALKFLNIMQPFFAAATSAPDKEARQRLIIEKMVGDWEEAPPNHPIIIAGSTGSRGATSLLMQAVARLPQGAIVLPGFDFDMPLESWNQLTDKSPIEDHPQYRFASLIRKLDLQPDDITPWDHGVAPSQARNRLVSLSLRPAPVTSQWLTEGPDLGDLLAATENMTLVETASPRVEAETIALRMRQAAQDGVTAALITPDRMLTRQVAAALDRWDITPDDSAGVPLAQSAPGRFLRHVGELLGANVTAEDLLVILKHPLCNTGSADRSNHLLRTRNLELKIRRYGPPLLNSAALHDWAVRNGANDPGLIAWATWIGDILDDLVAIDTAPLAKQLEKHVLAAVRFASGPDNMDGGELWKEAAGREALKACDLLAADADAGADMGPRDYINLFNAILSGGVVRNRDAGHPQLLIWGTLEARVQGADLVILGGLNDSVWPETPTPDPWLNRPMRQSVGLLLPERKIGLSAHDYQQAIAAKEVWITRSKRSTDAETVPSRWLNRLTNLLGGLPAQNGELALDRMRKEGDAWIAKAIALQEPVRTLPKATRPSPQPPLAARPKELSVTRIKTLVRDPYAIYADKVLGLSALDPLKASADPSLRGEIFHKVLELFILEKHDASDPAAVSRFLEISEQLLKDQCPWPTVRLQWMTQLEKLAPLFLADEAKRQDLGSFKVVEATGNIDIPDPVFKITAKADRIDLSNDGQAIIYDYKTGAVPTRGQQVSFDKQLLVQAAMVERGGFDALGKTSVADAMFIGVKSDMKVVPAPLDEHPTPEVWDNFLALLRRWNDVDRGYTARLAHLSIDDASPYDHLSRFGEWTMADTIDPVRLK